MLRHALFASCAAIVCMSDAISADTRGQADTYWYDGAVKVPLYRQPRLQASSNRPPASASSPRVVARRDERSIYKRAVDDPRGYTVYSITADPRGSSLLVQAPGVLFTVDDGASTHRVQQWLAARGLRARPIAGGAAFEVDGISGEKALDLANALYESKLVRHARPNWVTDSGRR